MPRRVGWTPLWGDFTKRTDLNVLQRVLAAPLRAWEFVLYDSRCAPPHPAPPPPAAVGHVGCTTTARIAAAPTHPPCLPRPAPRVQPKHHRLQDPKGAVAADPLGAALPAQCGPGWDGASGAGPHAGRLRGCACLPRQCVRAGRLHHRACLPRQCVLAGRLHHRAKPTPTPPGRPGLLPGPARPHHVVSQAPGRSGNGCPAGRAPACAAARHGAAARVLPPPARQAGRGTHWAPPPCRPRSVLRPRQERQVAPAGRDDRGHAHSAVGAAAPVLLPWPAPD